MTVPIEPLPRYLVTCQVQGCINFNIEINVPVDTNYPHVICGPCGNEITNMVPIVP
jgi:hypothetical protein